MKYLIEWTTKDHELIRRCQRYFNIGGMTINWNSVADVPDDRVDKFMDGVRKGIYRIRRTYE